MKQLFTLFALLLAGVCVQAQTASIVVYRAGKPYTDKYFVRATFVYDMNVADSLPVNHACHFDVAGEDTYTIRVDIENHASWPSDRIKISTISNDTTYVRALLAKDGLGNAKVKLQVVPRAEAKAEMASVGNNILYKSEREDEDGGTTVSAERVIRSGSGFLISRQGYVITNYHVVGDAKSVYVRNLNGDKNVSSKAVVVATDKTNDLIVLKLSDTTIVNDSINFCLKQNVCDLGEKVMVLGYPYTNSMGYDVKLTTGIVSSVNGYEGEVNSYQLSAPVQPGNSGGPVFDEKGNLIGVVSAKHRLAESATYAVKTSYLINLMQAVPGYRNECEVTNLWQLGMSDQVKALQKLVYIIEIK